MSETEKHRDETVQYCKGNGVDIGSGGDPVVPWAISLDLPAEKYAHYHSGEQPLHPVQWGGDAANLPFRNEACDFVYSSHVLEDFYSWDPILREWARVLKPGGYLIIMLPDKLRWTNAVKAGQPPNCEHRHESFPGELSEYIAQNKALQGFRVICDKFTNKTPEDYNILFVAQKQAALRTTAGTFI